MSIRNLKDGHKKPWLCECYPTGRSGRRIRKRFATKGEALAFESYTMKEADNAPWMGSKVDTRTLSELISIWYVLHGKNLKSGVHTHRRLELISENLNDPIASKLTTNDIAYYRAGRLSKKGEPVEISKTTHNYDIRILRSMFNELTRLNEWEHTNPVENVRPLKSTERELSFLNKQQITDLLESVESKPNSQDIKNVILICLMTGARIREAINLKGSQLSEYKITFIETKGRKNRTVPISKSFYHQIKTGESGNLFNCSYERLHNRIKTCITSLPKGQATHVLRHTFAAHFMMNGGNILVLQQILGHREIKQTMAYAHFSQSHLNDAVLFNPVCDMSQTT